MQNYSLNQQNAALLAAVQMRSNMCPNSSSRSSSINKNGTSSHDDKSMIQGGGGESGKGIYAMKWHFYKNRFTFVTD